MVNCQLSTLNSQLSTVEAVSTQEARLIVLTALAFIT